jgi:hypothetical protein
MMKQPAENANATPEEIAATLARAVPIVYDSPVITEEIVKLAYQYWKERECAEGSPEQDWLRAEKIVLNRLKATVTA